MQYHPYHPNLNSELARGDSRDVAMALNATSMPPTGSPHSVAVPASFFPTLPSFYRDYNNMEHMASQVMSTSIALKFKFQI